LKEKLMGGGWFKAAKRRPQRNLHWLLFAFVIFCDSPPFPIEKQPIGSGLC
jgi:hypothetical protein